MHTAAAHRGRGIAARFLDHLIAEARRRGYARLSLETGTPEAFAPARRLYARHGFEICPPFGDYSEDPYSVFMTLEFGQNEESYAPPCSVVRFENALFERFDKDPRRT